MGALPVLSRDLGAGTLTLRELRRRDSREWHDVRLSNADWLSPWEATVPPESGEQAPTYGQMVARFRAEGRAGRSLAFAMVWERRLVGQLTVAGIALGSLRSASIGYWIDQRVAGLGLTPMAVAMACDHCFGTLNLHRVEIVIRPENVASLRVVEKLGFPEEGYRPRYLHIDGDWRDHRVFALHAEQAPQSMADLLAARHDIGRRRHPRGPYPT